MRAAESRRVTAAAFRKCPSSPDADNRLAATDSDAHADGDTYRRRSGNSGTSSRRSYPETRRLSTSSVSAP